MDAIKSLEIPTSLRRISILSPTSKAHNTPNHESRSSVFAKPNSTRTEDEIKEAIKILKEVPFYASLQKEEEEMNKLLAETLDSIECKTFNQGEIVFHQSDDVAEFYIIIEGTVDIYAPKTEDEMNEEISQMENDNKTKSSDFTDLRRGSRMPRKSLFVPSIGMSDQGSDEIVPQFLPKNTPNSTRNLRASIGMKNTKTINSLLGLQDCFQMHRGQLLFRLKNRRTLGPGTHFGELALANNCNGSITVVAASDLQVACLSKEAFRNLCDESQRALHDKIDFFSKLMGKSKTGGSVARFCYGFKERQYSYGQKVFIQGQLPSEVFVVKHGEVQITNQECQERGSPKKGKLSVEKIANVGPYNLIGTGEVSGDQPYKLTATSCSHDLVLYVIPIKEFQSLKTSYQDVFERFSEKFRTQLSYFEDRAEDISSVKRRSVHLPSLSALLETKSPKASSRIRLGRFGHAKPIDNKIQQTSSSDIRVGFTRETPRVSVIKNQNKLISQSLLAGFQGENSLIQNNQMNSPSALRGERVQKVKPISGDHIDYLFSRQDKTRKRRPGRLSLMAPQESQQESQTSRDLNNREFNIGNTIKFLAEHTQMKRNSWNFSSQAQPTFLMENSPKAIFRNC